MPEFRRNGKAPAEGKKQAVSEVIEPRCKVCQSKFRRAIDRQLALGVSYSELERLFSAEGEKIDRRSFSNHEKKHLNLDDGALREIVRREAEAVQENIEEGISSVVNRRVYMEAALRKGLEGLMDGSILVDPRSALAMIEYLDKSDALAEEGAINEIRIQFNSFIKAIKEVVPKQYWDDIFKKSQEIIAKEQGGEIEAHIVMEEEDDEEGNVKALSENVSDS